MRIFVSYSRADTATAELVVANLQQAGHSVFFDRSGIQVAEDFNRVIWGEIQRADFFVFLISPHSVEKGSYALTELSLAERKWPNPERRVLCVLLEPVDLPAIPVYASICQLLKPVGNVAAEVRVAVDDLGRHHRVRRLTKAAVAVLALSALASLSFWAYQHYLAQQPLAAREKLIALDIYNPQNFIQSAGDGDTEMIELYLTAGQDPNVSREDDRVTALMLASSGGFGDVVQALLEAGADINRKDRYGDTALSWAAASARQRVLNLLLLAGADSASINRAFVVAGGRGHLDLVRQLLPHGISPVSLNAVFVDAAADNDIAMFRFMLDKVSDRAPVASAALIELANSSRQDGANDVVEATQAEITRTLLDMGADVNFQGKDGYTALTAAVIAAKPALVKLLLQNGAEVDLACECPGRKGGDWTPLQLAIDGWHRSDSGQVLETLLAKNADVNLARKGETPLMEAVYNGDPVLVNALLDMGARLNDQNTRGFTALAYVDDNDGILHLLLDRGASVDAGSNPLLSLVRRDYYDGVEILLTAGADVNGADADGQTPLMIAARESFADMVRLLLTSGARAEDRDKMGRSALTFARRAQQQEVIALLEQPSERVKD